MNKLIFVIFLLQACASVVHADTKPPTGEELFDLLLKNSALPLGKEPLCQQRSVTRKKSEITLGEHLATILSVSYQTKNTVQLKSSCLLSKYAAKAGTASDVWDCSLEMKESDAKGEFISSAMMAFYVTLDGAAIVRGGIRCF